ncbi:hypothetical protein ACFLSE_05835 [Bacteroidota bacterium]
MSNQKLTDNLKKNLERETRVILNRIESFEKKIEASLKGRLYSINKMFIEIINLPSSMIKKIDVENIKEEENDYLIIVDKKRNKLEFTPDRIWFKFYSIIFSTI